MIFVSSLHLEGIYFPCFMVASIILAFQRYSESDASGISMVFFRVLLAHVWYPVIYYSIYCILLESI